MNTIKVYIACYKMDFFLLRSCVASIRYWNKEVAIFLLKDLSKGDFDTSTLEKTFNVSIAKTTFKKLGAYIKLQPFIEHPAEIVFLQDADMIWLGDMIEKLKWINDAVAIDAYEPTDSNLELNRWYLNTTKLRQYYPAYKYPGFVFNTGSILLNTSFFSEKDFEDIILWKENAVPLHDNIFLCEDQGIINYTIAKKYLSNTISLTKISLQISSESSKAKTYDINKIKNNVPENIIVHWFGTKSGLNSFCSSGHLLRFFEKQYYSHLNNGNVRLQKDRLLRTVKHLDGFTYGLLKKTFYFLKPLKK